MLTARRGRLVAATLLTGVLALTGAGCGDKDKADAPAPTTQPTNDPGTAGTPGDSDSPSDEPSGDPSTPADDPTTPAGDETGAAGDLPDPCKGWTDADITKLTGLQIFTGEGAEKGGAQPFAAGDTQRECIWGVKGGHFLIGTQRTKADEFSPPGDGTGEIVDGIGDQAYFIKGNNELHVRKGELEIVVSFTKDESPSGDLTLIPVQKTIATKILETIGT
jgi:hypothetical protein